ncbi:MAG: peptidase domain-containing ABC transporter, partial [Acidobacteriota bacterium]
QRQRLAIARAILPRPRILLLDEATSALDTLTEQRVHLELRKTRCTRIVIAHRLSTVVDADRILVMSGGRVVEQGSHGSLLRRGGRYAALVAGDESLAAAS